MISYLLAGPAEEPVSLAEAKAYLRVDDGAEDALIATLITAGRLHVEGVTGKALVAQSWRLVLEDWPGDGIVRLPVTPLMSLAALTAYDEAGEGHELGLAGVLGERDRLVLPRRLEGAPRLRARSGVEIDYVAGFGEAGSDVPADLRQAVLVLVAHWHVHRDAVVIAGAGAVVPAGFDRLVIPHRRARL